MNKKDIICILYNVIIYIYKMEYYSAIKSIKQCYFHALSTLKSLWVVSVRCLGRIKKPDLSGTGVFSRREAYFNRLGFLFVKIYL